MAAAAPAPDVGWHRCIIDAVENVKVQDAVGVPVTLNHLFVVGRVIDAVSLADGAWELKLECGHPNPFVMKVVKYLITKHVGWSFTITPLPRLVGLSLEPNKPSRHGGTFASPRPKG